MESKEIFRRALPFLFPAAEGQQEQPDPWEVYKEAVWEEICLLDKNRLIRDFDVKYGDVFGSLAITLFCGQFRSVSLISMQFPPNLAARHAFWEFQQSYKLSGNPADHERP